jgi:hypothetical protein
VTANTRATFLAALASALIVGVLVGWQTHQAVTNVWKTKEAYFVRLDDGRMECMLSTDFLASLFGPDWRNQEIYIGHAGWTAQNSISCVSGPLAPMSSLTLNYAMRDIQQPKGNHWDINISLYSRKSKNGCALLVRMYDHKVIIQRKGPAQGKEIELPNGLLTFIPVPK